MDPYSQYKKQMEYHEIFQKQKENYTDLTNEGNDSIKEFAKILFNKSAKNLDRDLSGVLVDDEMETTDIFCMLVELVLYGLDILSDGKYTIFDLNESTDDVVYTIKHYLKSAGLDMIIQEHICEDNENPSLFRDRTDYFCEILPKPPRYLCHKGWYVLNYRIIDNKKNNLIAITPLEKFRAFFISKQKKIFLVNFKYA